MLYFRIIDNKVTAIAAEVLDSQHQDPTWIARHEIRSFEQAQQIAEQATALHAAMLPAAQRETFVAIDNGASRWPRFDVQALPKVGDKVSYAFNGDYYPDGEVTKISGKNYRVITTSSGRRYFRSRLSGSWLQGRMWYLVPGHIQRWNPEF